MQLGRVVGHAVSTVKHPSLHGWRLLLVQMLGADGRADGEPILAVDALGSAAGSLVLATNDGAAVQQAVGTRNTPLRWMVLGISDQ